MRPVELLPVALGRLVLLVLGREAVAVLPVLPLVPGVGRTLVPVPVEGLTETLLFGLAVPLLMVGRVELPPLTLLVLPETLALLAPVLPETLALLAPVLLPG